MVLNGIIMILLFALGHCLPIVIAGSSTAAVRKVIENQSWQTGGLWFRRGAGVLIGLLGLYFIINPSFFLMEGYAPMDLLCSLCGRESPLPLQKQPLEKERNE